MSIKGGCGRKECGASSGFSEELTFGTGDLDDWGYWSEPCAACARACERVYPEYAPCWPRNPRVLVVDDNSAIREVVASCLEDENYDVIEAANGAEAMNILRRESETIDVIITDYLMPGLCGEELIVAIQTLVPDIKLMVMTATSSDISKCVKVPVLKKPFGVDELLESAARLTHEKSLS